MADHQTGTGGYRPEVDGLRAIAVLSVVLYHMRNAWIPGGYVGVDIFFVISGFLITRNIWGELGDGRFSIGSFYLRRIRRIAPASLLVTAATLVAGVMLLLPPDLERLSIATIWTTLSAANIYFWKYLDTSYFAAANDQEPLLHFWSLGVEEQYYLIWPAMLLGLAATKRSRPVTIAAIMLICVGSFALAEFTNVSAQKFAYYMLPTRAGELMIGALLALYGSPRSLAVLPRSTRAPVRELLALVGMALIAFSLWGLDDTSPFPGINALYPCVGAALVIYAGLLDSRVTRLVLTPRPMVFIGLISYSLYLWHWPILAYIRYFYGEISLLNALLSGCAMLVLATLSYRWVERPARHMRATAPRQVLLLLVVPGLIVITAAVTLIRLDGLKATIEASPRFAEATERLARQTAAASREVYPCMDPKVSLASALEDPRCVLGAPRERTKPGLLLWGDSNAGHFIGTLDAVGQQQEFAFRYASLSACPPLFGAGEFGRASIRDRCTAYRMAMRDLIAQKRFGTIVLGAQWAVHDKNPELKPALERTIADIERMGLRTVLIGQVPGFPGYNKECELRLGRRQCAESQARARGLGFPISDYMAGLADSHPNVFFVDVDDVLCDSGRCSPYLNNLPVYFNPTHLSALGSFQIGQSLILNSSPAWREAFSGNTKAADSFVTRANGPTLFSGYRPSFKSKIRSQRHLEKEGRGQYQHVVITEYIDADAKQVVRALEVDLKRRGFSLEGPVDDRGAIRYVATLRSLKVTIIVHPDPSVKLHEPGAKGLVSYAWRDGQPR